MDSHGVQSETKTMLEASGDHLPPNPIERRRTAWRIFPGKGSAESANYFKLPDKNCCKRSDFGLARTSRGLPRSSTNP
jgi:hypothetical protein